MKIAVCIKQVPILSKIALDPESKTVRREGVPSEVSAFDIRALLKAIELRDLHGGEVVAVTMGPPQAASALEHCLALGADRALHLADRAFAGADTLATARTLAAALRSEAPDLILFGRHSLDAETGQVGAEVAELLGLPQASVARRVDLGADGKHILVDCEYDDGYCQLELALPAIVTAAEDLAEERFPSKADREAAKTKPTSTLTAADLGGDPTTFGAAGSPTWVAGLETSSESRRGIVVEGETPALAAQRLADILVDEVGLFSGWAAEPAAASVAAPARVGRDHPRDVWVIAETTAEGVHRVTLELLGQARQLADAVDGRVAAVLLDASNDAVAEQLAAHGADSIIAGAAARPWSDDPAATAAILAAAVTQLRPGVVLCGATSWGREVAPRLAGRLGVGLTSDCIGLEWDAEGRLRALKPAFGGSIVAPILSRTIPEMATARPGIFAVASKPRTAPTVLELPVPPDLTRSRRVVRFEPSAPTAAELDHAEIVLGVGMGLGSAEAIASLDPLRQILGASYCATRDVTDAGWLPRQHQVGLTGRAIAPKLYIGIGIRGAFEHTVGLRRAGCIVVVNKNPKAMAFKAADYGIVGDHAEVIPALVDALARRR